MSKSKKTALDWNNGNDGNKLDGKQRLSLQAPSITPPASSFRHTKSQIYSERAKRKAKVSMASIHTPPIIEAENSEDEIDNDKHNFPPKTSSKEKLVIENEQRRASRSSKTRNNSLISSKSTGSFVYENAAFEANRGSNSSVTNTVKTTSRAPSVQSLEVVREQYCCCTKRTGCERILLLIVTVLAIIIIVLVIVVIVLAKNMDTSELKFKF